MKGESMNYTEWLETVPVYLTEDSLWKMEAYRLALFAADFAWHDVTKLLQDKRTLGLASQLYDAMGSIGANLSEGIPTPSETADQGDRSNLLTNVPLP